MNVKSILSQVDKLHATAAKHSATPAKLKLQGDVYLLRFNGHSFVATREDGQHIGCMGTSIVYNTRKLAQAKTWLREWING